MDRKFRKQILFLGLVAAADLLLAASLFFSLARQTKKTEGAAEALTAVKDSDKGGGPGADWEPGVVALTFDDGPDARYTGALLDGLKERDVPASFFLIGQCIGGNEELVKRMEEEGHLIGVHCMEHRDLTKEPVEKAVGQFQETADRIEEVTGQRPEYVRPPFGKWSGELEEAVGMEPVLWTVDSLDWKLKNTDRIVKKVMKDTTNGDIILMHDEFLTSVEAALQIIDNLQANGYTFVTVDELLID